MYTAASMPGETGPVASASLGPAIENCGRERLGQVWHPASKCRTATERLGVCGTGRHQSRDGLASVRNRDFVPLSNLSNQCRQVLPGFTYSCFFHPAIVLHVALTCNCLTGNDQVSPEPGRAGPADARAAHRSSQLRVRVYPKIKGYRPLLEQPAVDPNHPSSACSAASG